MNEWCARTGAARGAVLSRDHLWAVARAWYSTRLSPDFRGRSAAEAQAIFAELGLTGPHWSV